MKNEDFEGFKKSCSWFIHQTDIVALTESQPVYTESFIKTFPILFKLLNKARAVDITITRIKKQKKTSSSYRLFSWDTIDRHRAGWLCKIETDDSTLKVFPEHQLLIDNLGGIQESYMEESEHEKLTDNQNFLFIKSECELIDEDNRAYYLEICEDEDCQPLDTKNFLAFAIEANGNATYCDLQTHEVFLFAADHAFDNVTSVTGQPEYTFYTIDGVDNFVDYVELLAKQWMTEIV